MRTRVLRKYLLVFGGLLVLCVLTLYGPFKSWHKFVSWPEGITTWAIVLTLFAIAEQTEQTSRAVDVANRALASQEATSKAQLRAYVGVVEAAVRRYQDGSIDAVLALKNSGQTPAHGLTGHTGFVFCSYPVGTLQPPPPDVKKGISVLAAGITQTVVTDRIGKQNPHLNRLWTGVDVFCLYGRYTYADVFQQLHSTSFQLILGGPVAIKLEQTGELQTARMSMDQEGNVAD